MCCITFNNCSKSYNQIILILHREARRFLTLIPCPPGPTLLTQKTTRCPISPTPASPRVRPLRGAVRIGRTMR